MTARVPAPGPRDNQDMEGAEALQIEVLAARAATGDEVAWERLWRMVEPRLDRELARPRFLGRLGQRQGDRAHLLAEIKARLRDRQFARLRVYGDARAEHAKLHFLGWLLVVAKRVGLEYARPR